MLGISGFSLSESEPSRSPFSSSAARDFLSGEDVDPGPVVLSLGCLGGKGGKRGPDDTGNGLRPRVERFIWPTVSAGPLPALHF